MANLLLTNATILNWSPRVVLPNQAILIREGRIAKIGDSESLTANEGGLPIYDCEGALVLPGAICAHTHFYGAFARGMAIPGVPPRDFPEILRRLWWGLDRALTLDDVRYSALLCLIDAIHGGTTTLIDHHASPNAIDGSLSVIAAAVEEAGLRGVLCYEVTDRDGAERAQAGIAENVRFLREMERRQDDRLAATFGLHASLTLSEETLRACTTANEPFGSGFHIHLAEHEADEEDSLARSGVRTTLRLKHHRILGARTIAAHAVHVDASEVALLRETETWVTHQPRSNMNNGVGVASLDELLRAGIKVCLGNDGFSHFMIDEWRAAYLVHKVAKRDPRAAGGETILHIAAEHNAALAEMFFPTLTLGVIQPGAAADLMIVAYDPFTPLTGENAPWHVLFGVESRMVVGTICAGKVVMRNREITTLDERKILSEARARAPHIWARYAALVGN